MSKIYTRTGDGGKTRLVGGTQVPKTDERLEAYGTVDELNSVLGLCHATLKDSISTSKSPDSLQTSLTMFEQEILNLQNSLFFIGSRLASEDAKTLAMLPPLPENAIPELEKQIDTWTALLPPLKEFILPGGHRLAAELHLARTVCRRAERMVAKTVVLAGSATKIDSVELRYLNRLSDYLFTAARFANLALGFTDRTWKKSKP